MLIRLGQQWNSIR